ncbi:MAG TPA: methyltransferase domain-containing protein [Dehalococcoidales bacterium]|nr:methyltransferase domain-containing protein [Dehalococcoidales bacterium]
MNYDAIEEERKWYRRGRKASKRRPLPERHHFAHSCVRSKLYSTLAGLGCRDTSSILEIGCGSGEELTFVSRASSNITAIDVSQTALKGCRVKGVNGVLADARILPFRNGSFDYVLCSAVLHHLVGQGDLGDYLKEFARVTRQKGYVIALEPNLFNLSGILMNIFNIIKPGITGLVPHERALSPFYLNNVFKSADLREITCVSASYTWNRFPLWISKLISRYEDRLRLKKPFSLFGWFVIVWGQK